MLEHLNLLAVLVAALSSFMLGGLWYGPLFGKAWIRELGFDESQAGHPAKVFGISFVCQLLAALGFAVILGPAPDMAIAIHHGLVIGIAFVGTSFMVNYQFSNKSYTLLLIDAGYCIANFLIFGVILALWH